jgi:predicted RNA-binding protein YlqC (UPF0109 family)
MHRPHWQRSTCIRRSISWRGLLAEIAKTLVDHPEEVQVRTIHGQVLSILELRVHPEDLGKVIGRHGSTANALRTIIGAAGSKLHEHVTVEIIN